jgi:hypothetical protein
LLLQVQNVVAIHGDAGGARGLQVTGHSSDKFIEPAVEIKRLTNNVLKTGCRVEAGLRLGRVERAEYVRKYLEELSGVDAEA